MIVSVALVALCAAQVFVLSVNETINGIPDSDEKEYLFINEKAKEYWFQLGTRPVGTIISTDAADHVAFTLFSDGSGLCYGDGTYTFSTGIATLILDVKADNDTNPTARNIWIIAKDQTLHNCPESYAPMSMPANTGFYARSVDIHSHKFFGWTKDDKLKVWDTAFSIWSYYKGESRPFPTIEIDIEECPTRYLIFFFEINDRCMQSVELYDDHFDVAMNGTQLPQNAVNTTIYRFPDSAHGIIISFSSRGAVLIKPEPFHFRHLGYCDLGPDYMERDHFELQAFVDKRYELRDCVDPGFKFLDEAPIKRPPKKERRQSTLFSEPKKLRKRKAKRGKMYRFMFHDVNRPTLVASSIVCGTFLILNITANTAYLVYRYLRQRRRLQPIGPNAIS